MTTHGRNPSLKYIGYSGVDPEEVHVKGNVIYPVCERVNGDSQGSDRWNRIYS